MGKKRKLEDREIKKTVSREKLLNISQRKLSKVKRLKYLLHRCAKTIYNTLKGYELHIYPSAFLVINPPSPTFVTGS